MENSFNPGDIVYARNAPHVKLVVRRYVDELYYCRVYNHPENKEMSYYGRDLKVSSNPAERKHL